jgi:hypothetical protein
VQEEVASSRFLPATRLLDNDPLQCPDETERCPCGIEHRRVRFLRHSPSWVQGLSRKQLSVTAQKGRLCTCSHRIKNQGHVLQFVLLFLTKQLTSLFYQAGSCV